MKLQKPTFIVLGVLSLVTACSSTSNTTSSSGASVQSNSEEQFSQLNADQIRSQIVGNTLTGTSNNFPQAGTIDFSVHYAPDGTAKDRLRFRRGGRVDRAIGAWRIANEEEGIFCSTFAKRRQGAEVCTRIFVSGENFRSEPLDANIKGTSGRIVVGDQVS